MAPTKTQRWLDLVALLLGRRVPLPVEEIMERLPAYAAKWNGGSETDRATARRTFERDKDDLRKLGIPLEPVSYAVNHGAEQYEGYRIAHKDFYLPYLRLAGEEEEAAVAADAAAARPYQSVPGLELAPAEAEAAIEALRQAVEIPAFPFAAEAASALRKLSFDLDVERIASDPVVWVGRPGSEEVLARLRTLSDALLTRKRVFFRYHGLQRGRTTEREIAPYGLFFQRDWYLVGHDAEADGLRMFRVSRMEEVEANTMAPKSPDFEVPADFSLQDHLEQRAWELGEEARAIEAEVHFRFPVSLRVERNGEGEWVRDTSEGGAVRRFSVARPDPFLRWILSMSGEAEILSPPELVAELRGMARAVAALYPEVTAAVRDG